MTPELETIIFVVLVLCIIALLDSNLTAHRTIRPLTEVLQRSTAALKESREAHEKYRDVAEEVIEKQSRRALH